MFTIPLFSDWEMDFNREAYEVALTATLERFESGLGTELTLSPASEFRIGLGGRISRKSISARTDIDFPMIAYVQNLIRSTRRAKYDSGKHVIERRCLDRLPLKDGSTKWYGEKSKSLEFWSKFDKGTGTGAYAGFFDVGDDEVLISAWDTPHTSFPAMFPGTKSPMEEAICEDEFVICLAAEASWDKTLRHAICSVDWSSRLSAVRDSSASGGYKLRCSMQHGTVQLLDKPLSATDLVDGGPAPNDSEHVFIDNVDKGPTRTA